MKIRKILTIFIITFSFFLFLSNNANALEDMIPIEIPTEEIAIEYYLPENLEIPAIKMYEDKETNTYKYEVLNDFTINLGFNNFYTNKQRLFKFYLLENNEVARGIIKINGKYYCFNKEGMLQYGWQTISNNRYFFDTTTGIAYSEKKTINNKTYYFSEKGMILKGFRKINGYTYYFTEYGMQTGWKKINNNYYYFNSKGQATKGFKRIDNKLYYFNKYGINKTGIIKSGNKYYCLYKNKLVKNKWVKYNGKYYYFNNNSVAVKGWHRINSKKYYFKSNGTMATGLTKVGKYTYYFGSNGQIKKGLRIIGNHKYYFNYKGHMYSGLKKINNKIYYFSSKNGKSTDGFIKYRGNYYYIKNHQFTKNKWKKINGKHYYFSKTGKAYKNTTKKINKVYYKFNIYAQAINGYYKKNNNIYYKDAKGNIMTGKKYIFGIKQYFSPTGIRTTYKKIIDVSEFQGKINWEEVKKTYVQGAIIRLGFTGSESRKNVEDAYIGYNIENTVKYNIPIGIYYYGYSTTESATIKEADFVLETLKKYGNPNLKYPIFYDAEVSKIGRSNYEKVINAFAKVILNAGYEFGVYGNANAFYSDNGYLNSSKIKQYPMWVAHYNTNYSSHYVSGYKTSYGWQYTSSAKINGISTRVDMSNWYK